MTQIAGASLLDWAKDVGVPLVTFVLGFGAARWTLTKKDRKDLEQKNYENSTALVTQHDAAYVSYTGAISAYVAAPAATVENFVAIATLGDRYFMQLNQMCSAILSQKVDVLLRDEVLLPKVRDAVLRTLPDHYETLHAIAAKQDFSYSGALRRSDHGAVYAVAEKFGAGPEWATPTVRESTK